MKFLLIFSVVAAITRSSLGYGGGSGVAVQGVVPVNVLPQYPVKPVIHSHPTTGYGLVDFTFGYSEYHFSWRHDGGRKYSWNDANQYCNNLGYGWKGLSIETREEDQCISHIIEKEYIKYIWTGGFRSGYDWAWPSGGQFYGLNWSPTGGSGYPQPDNYENGQEYCLAVLNNFYNDGVKWHDVACHHEKPIICERSRQYHRG